MDFLTKDFLPSTNSIGEGFRDFGRLVVFEKTTLWKTKVNNCYPPRV